MSNKSAAQTARFADNTSIQPIDRRRVYGYSAGHWFMSMNPRASNLAGYQIPQGQLILFKPRVDGYLKDRMKTVMGPNGERLLSFDAKQEYSARHYADAVAARFHGGKDDFGFRVLDMLTALEYDKTTGYDEADAYFETLHPPLTCEMGLEVPNPRGAAGDIINKGVPLPCPTCRLKWLKNESDEAIAQSGLDKKILKQLRDTLISACEAAINLAQFKLGKATGEVESGKGKTRYDDADYHFMKMLHKKAKHIEQAEITSEAARIQGEAIGRSVADALKAAKVEAENERLKAELAALKAEAKKKKD